jgi:O-antigen/teichoic acid export membrane protein
MRKYYDLLTGLIFSATAKDALVLFVGNLTSSFWGFLFVLILARSLSVVDFGIFSAAYNFVIILVSLADIGISSGSVNFISEHLGKGNSEKADEYVKASFIVRLLIVFGISVVAALLAPFITGRLFASKDLSVGFWAAALPIFIFPDMFFPFILQARKKFIQSTVIDNAFYLARLAFAFSFYVVGGLTMSVAFWAFGAGFLVEMLLIYIFVRPDFLFSKPTRAEYKSLLGFSGWIGVNRIISSISGRLDVQMLAAMTGAFATGLYSIPSRLAFFIVVLSSSFSSVLAPRLASFGDKWKERIYIIKSTMALLPITAGIIFWIIVAKPFILLLFGSKYLPSVPVFQALAVSMIPFLFTAPSVTAIVYSMKKTVFIGMFSFFQLAAVFLLNYVFIPRFGPIGPAITLGITNVILAVYTWYVVLKYYWFGNEK